MQDSVDSARIMLFGKENYHILIQGYAAVNTCIQITTRSVGIEQEEKNSGVHVLDKITIQGFQLLDDMG